MNAVWAWALYTPEGRLSDWYRTEEQCPSPRKWLSYRASDLGRQRKYVGDMTDAEARRFFDAADPALGYDECKRSAQARFRNRILAPRILDMMADMPHVGPAE